jgi:hypothetical protein
MEPIKESLDPSEKTQVINLTLQEVVDLNRNPEKFKTLFLSKFPHEEGAFIDNSETGFRGARTRSGLEQEKEITTNLKTTGAEFTDQHLTRPVGIYIQPGSFADSYERSVHFAFGENEDHGETFEPQVGNVGVFSIYTIQNVDKILIAPESVKYPGKGASNKKFVPRDESTTWNDLRRASLVFRIV